MFRLNSVEGTRVLAVSCLLTLVGVGLYWELVGAPLRAGGSWWALKVLPLCIPLAGLLKNRLYTYRWLSLVVWLYFMEAVVRAYGDASPSHLYAWAQLLLCLVLFVVCAWYVRLRFSQARRQEKGQDAPSERACKNVNEENRGQQDEHSS